MVTNVDETRRLELIVEAVRYCQRVRDMGMPASCYSKALREPAHFLWERRLGPKWQIPTFRSKRSVGVPPGTRGLVYDHAVPFRYLSAALLDTPSVTTGSVREALDRFSQIVIITKDEDDALMAAGYSSKMPEHWDGVDALARYRAVGIELVPNADRGDKAP
jgi:hypothetical protein